MGRHFNAHKQCGFHAPQVQYGKKADWPLNVREQDFIVNQPKQYPRARIKRDVRSAVNYVLTNLPANTDVTLHVRVLAKYYVGPPSNVLEFATKEGGERSSCAPFLYCTELPHLLG